MGWMAHRKWKENKQQPGRAGPGNMLGCCLLFSISCGPSTPSALCSNCTSFQWGAFAFVVRWKLSCPPPCITADDTRMAHPSTNSAEQHKHNLYQRLLSRPWTNSLQASVVMQRLSYPAETVLSNKITRNRIHAVWFIRNTVKFSTVLFLSRS